MKAQYQLNKHHPPKNETEISGRESRGSIQQQPNVIRLYEKIQAESLLKAKEMLPDKKGPGLETNGKNEDAIIKTLLDGIIRYAMQKEFSKADKLRDKLIEIAPMALSEITRSAEIIEQEKIHAMDTRKIEPWADLFRKFTPGEAAAFYFALKDMVAKSGAPVFTQGNPDNRLYFIQSGRLALSYYSHELNRDTDLAVLQRGDISGMEAFFTFTIPTFTLMPLVDSAICFLEKEAFQKILADYPGIESKLSDYCTAHQKKCRVIRKDQQARRAHRRHQTSLTAKVQKIDKQGTLVGNMSSVTVVDISSGGLCYMMQNLKSSEAALLHQKWLCFTISYQKGLAAQNVRKAAKVVSVQYHPFGECSVHVRFKEPMEVKRVFEIAQSGGVTARI